MTVLSVTLVPAGPPAEAAGGELPGRAPGVPGVLPAEEGGAPAPRPAPRHEAGRGEGGAEAAQPQHQR